MNHNHHCPKILQQEVQLLDQTSTFSGLQEPPYAFSSPSRNMNTDNV